MTLGSRSVFISVSRERFVLGSCFRCGGVARGKAPAAGVFVCVLADLLNCVDGVPVGLFFIMLSV